MEKLHILFAAIAILFGSCSNDELAIEQPEQKGSAPQLVATVEQEVITKSGVIENNDYTLGEKFYWSNKDATSVLFKNSSMDEDEYKLAHYEAIVAQGVQNNNCTFDLVDSEIINNGAYTAYGLFPTEAWEDWCYATNFLETYVPTYQIQNEDNSTHLGAYMLMKAQGDVTVDGSNPINLTYKHLASVLRFAVWNNSSNNGLKLTNINVKLSSGKAVFASKANLKDVNATSLTIHSSSKVPELTLQLTGDARNFSTKDGKSQGEGYVAVLPTATDAFGNSDNLIIELSFTDETNNYYTTKTYNIETDLSFLSNGIEQGKSYYFQLKVDNSDLNTITGTSYAVGDYWPTQADPKGIVFWVKPGSFGTQGKVVGLKETYVSQWGDDDDGVGKDEEAEGVIGIRSMTDGATATRNMIIKYKSSETFSTDYPAFYYIYKIVNNGDENGAWYLPARDELKMLYAGYSGKIYEQITNWGDNKDMPGYDSQECKDARSGFNSKLTAKSGMAIGGNTEQGVEWYYLSSSEYSDKLSYLLKFDQGMPHVDRKSYDGNIRWIRNF